MRLGPWASLPTPFLERAIQTGSTFLSGFMFLTGCMFLAGCTGPMFVSQIPEAAAEVESGVTLVEDIARPYGMKLHKVEAEGLIVGLDGTGSDPNPSPQRAALLEEMKRRKTDEPGKVLASTNSALVSVRGILRPGVQKGDRIDLDIRAPSRGDTSSLRGGWLMPIRLSENAVLDRHVRKGHVLATGKGAVLVDPSADGEEQRELLTRGRILGGGIVTKSRPIGLTIMDQDRSIDVGKRVGTAVQLGSAINRRFHTFYDGSKKGVANPKTDEFVELVIHPRYKDNVARYMRVIRNIAVGENSFGLRQRIELLERQLLDPVTSAVAAIRLEAIGAEAVDTLRKGLASDNPEIRFYSAEALAYLDVDDAVEPLIVAARDEPAFRVHSLAALSAMDNLAAQHALQKLLSVQSSETRYGAFRALWSMTSRDPLVRGENLGGRFSFHEIAVEGPPMIHITRSFRPEIVLFGSDHRFQMPMTLSAGKYIMITGRSETGVSVSRFAPNEPEQTRDVENTVTAVVRAIVELKGTYPDVVQALQQAKDSGGLKSRLAFDALPEGDRTYDREVEVNLTESDEEEISAPWGVPNPLPDLLFRNNR